MCLLVMAASLLVQVAAALIGQVLISIITSFRAGSQGIRDYATIYQMTIDAVMDAMPYILLLSHVMILLIFGLWYYFGCGRKTPKNLRASFTGKNIAVIGLVAVSLCFLVNFGLTVLYPIIPTGIMEDYVEMMETAGIGENALSIFVSVCVAPFGEELVFRGTCMHYASKMVDDVADRRRAFWIANTVQALCFGIFHFNLVQGTYAFILGLALGYLVKKTGSLFSSIAAHMIINAISSFLWEPITGVLPDSMLVYGIGAVVSFAVCAAGLHLGGPAVRNVNKS